MVNVSINPSWLQGPQRAAVATLIKTYFELGGMQLQFTPIDQQTLRDAIEHPQAHRALMVRVSGYAARFTELAPALQQEILTRTIH